MSLKLLKLKHEYRKFDSSLLQQGRLPMRSTLRGFWSAAIADEIAELFEKVKLRPSYRFLDIGSGDGRVVLLAALKCRYATGIEIDNSLHLKALEVRNKLAIPNASFINDDFYNHDFSKYDILFVNPDQPMGRGLSQKLFNELNGKLVVYSNHFQPLGLALKESFNLNGNLAAVYTK